MFTFKIILLFGLKYFHEFFMKFLYEKFYISKSIVRIHYYFSASFCCNKKKLKNKNVSLIMLSFLRVKK